MQSPGALFQERIEGKDREIEQYKERLLEWEYRYQELAQMLPKALPPIPRSFLRRIKEQFPLP